MPTNNQLAGAWRLRHTDQPRRDVDRTLRCGARRAAEHSPTDLHFSVAIVRPDLPHVASGDRMSATDEENRAIARGSIGFYGTYRVDGDGAFAGQHVAGSTNPGLTGQTLGDDALTVSGDRDELIMTSRAPGPPIGETAWQTGHFAAPAAPANQVAAAWRTQSATVDADGETIEPFGAQPALIFTEGLYFTDVLHRSDLPAFAGGDPLRGTDEENRRIVQGSLIVFGSYTVDDDGVFQDEVVLGSSRPNWNGMSRDRSILTETVHGDRMSEHLDDGDGAVVSIEFTRAARV